MLILVLTRHGLTDRSEPEQHLGQRIDIGLSASGRAQAEALRERLRSDRFDRVVASPLRRAMETAAIVAGDGRVEIDSRLIEMDYGAWEGLTYAEIAAGDAAYRTRWEADPARSPCPGGESGNDVAKRARSLLVDELAASPGEARRVVLAVGHSTLDRILLCVALGVPVRDFRRRFTHGQANISVLQWPVDGRPSDARLVAANVPSSPDPERSPWHQSPRHP
jgi:broad specificity phosphatase PhoE